MMKNYHSFLSFSTEEQAALPGIIVPQGLYEPTVPNFSPLPSVRFQIGGQFGLRLQDVFTGQLAGLRDSAGTAMLSSPGNMITLRLYVSMPHTYQSTFFHALTQWPGYNMVSRSIFLLNAMGTPSVVTRDALAKRTAAAIRELHTVRISFQTRFLSLSWHS